MNKEKTDPVGLWVGCPALRELPNIALLMSDDPIDGNYPRCPTPRAFRAKKKEDIIAYMHEFDDIYDAGIGDSILALLKEMEPGVFNAMYFALLSGEEGGFELLEPKEGEPFVWIRKRRIALNYAIVFYVMIYMISKFPMTVVQRTMVHSARIWFKNYTKHLEGVFKQTFLASSENLA